MTDPHLLMTVTTKAAAAGTANQLKATRVPWQLKFTALAFIWGSSFLLMKVGLRSLAPLQISGLRILSGAVVLMVLLTASGGRLPRQRRVWGHLMVTGFFRVACRSACSRWGSSGSARRLQASVTRSPR